MELVSDNKTVNDKSIMESLERTSKYGTEPNKQISIVDKMMDEEGAVPIGMGYYIANKNGKIFCVDPWANVIEYKAIDLTKEEDRDV